MPPFAHARFDAHVHVWGPLDGHTATMLGSTPGTPPPPGDPAALLAALDAAGVAGACVVQPACYGYDHTYVGGVVAASGGRLTGCALAGTDWPWVTDFCSYGEAWAALDGVWEGWEPESGGMSGGEARAAVEGGNAARLFRWKGSG